MDRYDRREWRRARRERFRGHGHGGLVGGVILAGIGLVLLLQNLGIPFFDDLERYWPLILIVVGFGAAARAMGMGGRIWGGVVFSVGVVFLLKNFEVIHGDVWRFVWPGVLIIIGLGMLARSIDRHTSGAYNPAGGGDYAKNLAEDIKNRVKSQIDSSMGGTGASTPLNQLSEWAIFSGVRRRIDTQDFQGGEAFAMFGGVELDLRKAGSTREEIVMEINALFGGVEVRVPENWNVTVRGSGIFGGYEDKTMDMRGAPDPKQPHLVVYGFAVFGGVTIQN